MSIEQVCEVPTGEEVVGALRAEFAERCRSDARFLRLLHEAGRARAGRAERLAALDAFAGDEVAAALGWSRTMAARQSGLADDLIGRLAPVLAAMESGVLELGKAALFSETLADLDDDHAILVCAAVLPRAAGLNRTQLVEDLGTVAAEIDGEWARRREAAAAARGDVFGRATMSGTADVVGRNLDADRAWEGIARVDALAAELRTMLRPRGLRRPIGWLRKQVLQRLMDGRAAGVDDPTMLEVLAAEILAADLATTAPDADDDPGPGGSGPGGPGPDGPGPDGSGPDGPGPDGSGPAGSGDPGPDGCGPDTDGPDAGGLGPDSPGCPDGGGPRDDRSDATTGEGGVFAAGDADAVRGIRRGVLNVRLRLSTALGLDELPGELASRGPLLAHIARAMIAERGAGEWRLVLTSDDGQLEHVLLIAGRPDCTRAAGARSGGGPSPPHRPGRSRRRGRARDDVEGRAIVELQVPTTTLRALDPGAHPGWIAVLLEARARLDDPALTDPSRHPSTATVDAWRRRAGAELDRWTRTRDRHCIGIMCHQPAHGADLDHTRDWARGGTTVAANLGAPCRHCHRLKHEGGWTLAQPVPGWFRWRSRAGATYERRPHPVIRTPAPASRRADGRPRVPFEERFAPVPHRTPAWIPLPDPEERRRRAARAEPEPDARHVALAGLGAGRRRGPASSTRYVSTGRVATTVDDIPPPF